MAAHKSTYSGSDSRLDIPLREPLDPEYRLNRKLAKQIYNKEKQDKVRKHKEDLQQVGQQIVNQKEKKERAALKAREKAKEQTQMERAHKVEKQNQKRADAENRFKIDNQEKLQKLRHDADEADAKIKEEKRKKAADAIQREKERFDAD